MRKVLLLLWIVAVTWANEDRYGAQVIEKIADALCRPNAEQTIEVYAVGEHEQSMIKASERLRLSPSCVGADLILVRNLSELPYECLSRERLIFATRYRTFKYSDEVIGAFFWQKGRANLVFERGRLERHNIELPDELKRFVEEIKAL